MTQHELRFEKYFDFLQKRYFSLDEFIKDKEKKKLSMVAGGYAVFSLVTTVLIGMLEFVSKGESGYSALFSLQSVFIYSLFIISVVMIYTSIIKYIMAIKADSILAVRQMNCLRHAINSGIYLCLVGEHPKSLPQKKPSKNGGNASDQEGSGSVVIKTIVDESTEYWKMYGQHDKYPLQNQTLRNEYCSDKIYFRSADIYATLIMAVFACLMIITPFAFLLSKMRGNIKQDLIAQIALSDSYFVGFLSLVATTIAALYFFFRLVKETMSVDMDRIRRYCDAGQPFGWDWESWEPARQVPPCKEEGNA